MKSLKIGLIALALATGVTAYATSSKTNETACSTTSGSIDDECPFGIEECCVTTAPVTQDQGAGQVPIAANRLVLKSIE